MSNLFRKQTGRIRILDPGAGTGMLFAACVEKFCAGPIAPQSIEVVAYEIDPLLHADLNATIDACRQYCSHKGVGFDAQLVGADFIESSVIALSDDLFEKKAQSFTAAILNPPYKKINNNSRARLLLDSLGFETTNMYSAFMWLTINLLGADGELAAITPRSFCNGPYFKKFRKDFLQTMQLNRIHIFESREQIFHSDKVLQENVIVHATKNVSREKSIIISLSENLGHVSSQRPFDYGRVIREGDKDFFIHIPTRQESDRIVQQMSSLKASLADLGLLVSTGKVVDFRAKEFLRNQPDQNSYPLIYPMHFASGYIEWPRLDGKKPNALQKNQQTESLLVPVGYYVLARRFSAKEERRRVVAAIYDPSRVPAPKVGFENHLNYYHQNGHGLTGALAKGLALYLNSTLVDQYFREFNGHTQVNATDLRKLRYPSVNELVRLGAYVNGQIPTQEEIDHILESELFTNGQKKMLPKNGN